MAELTPVDAAVLRVAVLTWMAKRVKAATDEARSEAVGLLKKGDGITARSPIDDRRIARVTLSDPKRTASYTDRAAVDAWIAERYPEKLIERTEITGPMPEVLRVLREHAPHLLTDRKSVPDWAANELLILSEKAGEPVGFGGEVGEDAPPGIAVSIPDGVLSVRLDYEGADVAIPEMWDLRMMGMDGHVRQIGGAS